MIRYVVTRCALPGSLGEGELPPARGRPAYRTFLREAPCVI